jgi:dTDP-4-amino-4,6-dideoxygalactose transaminase
LHLAALAAGFESGNEVITSPITFAASANCILYAGAKPVFADIDPQTRCLSEETVRAVLSEQSRGLIPVHFAGHPCPMPALHRMAKERGLVVIEDAAHALGSSYVHEERRFSVGSCAHSDLAIFSFHPVKHITTGEGGMITTNDEELFRKLLLLRSHGITRDPDFLERNEGPWYYEMQALGFNYRITDFQCALGLSQLKRAEVLAARRAAIVARYQEAFSAFPGLEVPGIAPWADPSFHLYVVGVKGERRRIFQALREQGLGVNVHYLPVYLHPFYRKLGYQPGCCPAAEDYYSGAITLPLFPRMSDEEVDYVIGAVREVLERET